MKRFFLLSFFCLQAVIMSADVVKGRVVDAESEESLEGATVHLGIEIMNQYGYSYSITTDSCGQFQFTVGSMSKVSIKIDYLGYKSLNKSFNCAGGTKDTLNLGDLKLKITPELMKEVTVKGKVKSFYMKGDTVVFNPDAFNLDSGDRIATLLQKLPGVSIKEGKLYFMDKELHLKVNGRDVADDFLTGQLPAEAVQNIKAYEKKSELAELSGMDDGQEQQVLDIVIKPGFMDKWYGQTKASAFASKNYRASANLHYLTDRTPINLYVRASDCGSKTYGVHGEYEVDYETSVPQRQHYGKFSYQHNWKPQFVKSSHEDFWSVAVSPDHNDIYQNSWQNSETYLSGQPSSFSNSHNYGYNHRLDLPLDFETYLHLGSQTWLQIWTGGSFNRTESHTNSEQKTYKGDMYSADPQEIVNSSSSKTSGQTNSGNVNYRAQLSHTFKNGDVYAMLYMAYQNNKSESDSHSEYDYHELGIRESLVQKSQNNSNAFQTIFDTKVSYQLVPKKLKLGVAYWIDFVRNNYDNNQYRNGAYDFTNSYDQRSGYFVNEPRVELSADLGELYMLARLKVQNVEELFDYQRGKLDTVAHRNTWFPRPFFEFKWKTTKTTELKGSMSWEYHVANLLDGMDYVDDTNLLNVVMGNPRLKASSELNSNLNYSMMFTKGQQMLAWGLRYYRNFDPVSGVSAYDSQTGRYISSKTNVDDRQRWSINTNYDRSLGRYFRMRSNTEFAYNRNYGIKTKASWNDPMEQFHQTGSSVAENLRFTFQNNGWEASTYTTFRYSSLSYSDQTINDQKLWNYQAEMSGTYKMKHWTFSLYGRLVGNTGYLSEVIDRNRFALDASVTWKMLKNKGLLTFAAKDILNQMDDTHYNLTPTMRSESYSETFHRYFALTFTYNFDAKAKTKQGK